MPEVAERAPGGRAALRSFNLLPWRAQQRKARRRQAVVMLASGSLAALALLAAIELPLRQRLHTADERIGQLGAAISLARRTAGDQAALEERRAQASSLLAEVDRIRQRNSMARNWLAALPARIPVGLRLTELAVAPDGWQLRGVAAELNQPAELLQRVREMPMVADVRMDQLQSNPDASRRFLIAGRFEQ
ncbi:MAG: hypothetical protein OXF66_04635 [Gammaproteobacteria bacterium]|nr:hypothetical protein [Gammaproteobacteria bacterium]MCY4254683.1 hypothetical protein [Gammaproteobacteria bacterium]